MSPGLFVVSSGETLITARSRSAAATFKLISPQKTRFKLRLRKAAVPEANLNNQGNLLELFTPLLRTETHVINIST